MNRDVPDSLRAMGAGCFVWAGILTTVALLGMCTSVLKGRETDDLSPSYVVVLVGLSLTFIVLTIVALVIFNSGGWSYVSGKDPDALVREWEEQGLLELASYRAVRAFQVEEYEDEGLTFFLELDNHSVLYLNGQYLYEYEEIVDDVEVPIPRRFPNTEFTVRTYRPGGYVVDLICTGTAFEPEVVTPPFSDWGNIDDHTVITDKSYDELRDERLRGEEGRER